MNHITVTLTEDQYDQIEALVLKHKWEMEKVEDRRYYKKTALAFVKRLETKLAKAKI